MLTLPTPNAQSQVCPVERQCLIGQRHGNIYETILRNETQGKVRCSFSKTSTEESWKWHKALPNLNSKKVCLLIKQRETATAEEESFLKNQESLTSPNSERIPESSPSGTIIFKNSMLGIDVSVDDNQNYEIGN